jgi:beta-glucosidase
MKKLVFSFLVAALFLIVSCGPKWKETEVNGVKIVTNEGGKTLGYSSSSGLKLITQDRLAFKDLNKDGKLDKYEDWRLPVDERAKDLASKLSVEQIAGLMLYSRHQRIPTGSQGFMSGTYNGKAFEESGRRLLIFLINKRNS